MGATAERPEGKRQVAHVSVILARRSPTEKLAPEIGASTCPMQGNNLVAVLAVFVVEFSYGLAVPFMELSVGKPERNRERPDDEPQHNTGRSEHKQRGSEKAANSLVRRALQKAARHGAAQRTVLPCRSWSSRRTSLSAIAERLGGKLERDSKRSEGKRQVAHTSVILARRRPAEKLSPEIGASTRLVRKNNLNAIQGDLRASSEGARKRQTVS